MIIVKLSGGLGNQMFQYALICALQKWFPGTTVKADVSTYKLYDAHNGFELNRIFSLDKRAGLKVASMREQYAVRGEIPLFMGGSVGRKVEIPVAWFNARSREVFTRFGRRHVIREEDGSPEEVLGRLQGLDPKLHWYIDGYWQNEIYFREVINLLRERFVFPTLDDNRNGDTAKLLRRGNSVGIHVRRGDYVHSEFDVLSMDYYRRAVEYVRARVEEPEFFVFSDDETYAREAFAWLESVHIVSPNRGAESYRDLQLMSLCRHNIIANSSFSTWAGYLNPHEDKLVVYPDRYTVSAMNTRRTEPGWVMLKSGEEK